MNHKFSNYESLNHELRILHIFWTVESTSCSFEAEQLVIAIILQSFSLFKIIKGKSIMRLKIINLFAINQIFSMIRPTLSSTLLSFGRKSVSEEYNRLRNASKLLLQYKYVALWLSTFRIPTIALQWDLTNKNLAYLLVKKSNYTNQQVFADKILQV